MGYRILFGQTKEFDEARRTKTAYPCGFPHALIEPHDEQAQKNHSQTLERLSQRGGLSPLEIWCIVHDKRWHDKGDMTEAKAIEWLRGIEGVEWRIP